MKFIQIYKSYVLCICVILYPIYVTWDLLLTMTNLGFVVFLCDNISFISKLLKMEVYCGYLG